MNSLSDEAITVLLVEDDAPTLWRLQDALAKAGYRVRAAGTLRTPAPAWQKARRVYCSPIFNCRTDMAST